MTNCFYWEEYYIVLEGAPISQEVRAMGRPLQNAPVLTYHLDSEDGAHTAVRYERFYQMIERGERKVSLDTLIGLSKTLNIRCSHHTCKRFIITNNRIIERTFTKYKR